ncbi:MAG: hypothetical protein KC561_20990, partial [Myxococcales bacterium]|nr:hypothetical protein [Myxococcales bacterium]
MSKVRVRGEQVRSPRFPGPTCMMFLTVGLALLPFSSCSSDDSDEASEIRFDEGEVGASEEVWPMLSGTVANGLICEDLVVQGHPVHRCGEGGSTATQLEAAWFERGSNGLPYWRGGPRWGRSPRGVLLAHSESAGWTANSGLGDPRSAPVRVDFGGSGNFQDAAYFEDSQVMWAQFQT